MSEQPDIAPSMIWSPDADFGEDVDQSDDAALPGADDELLSDDLITADPEVSDDTVAGATEIIEPAGAFPINPDLVADELGAVTPDADNDADGATYPIDPGLIALGPDVSDSGPQLDQAQVFQSADDAIDTARSTLGSDANGVDSAHVPPEDTQIAGAPDLAKELADSVDAALPGLTAGVSTAYESAPDALASAGQQHSDPGLGLMQKSTVPATPKDRSQFDASDLVPDLPVHPEVTLDPYDRYVVHDPFDRMPSGDEIVLAREYGLFWRLELARDGDLFLEETTVDGDLTGRYVHLRSPLPGDWEIEEEGTASLTVRFKITVSRAKEFKVKTVYERTFGADPAASLEP